MTQLFSQYFGSFEIREDDIIHFPSGLPGFEDQTHYAAVSIPGQEPILYLQSMTRPELCLITLPARVFDQQYHLEINAEDRDHLGLPCHAVPVIGTEVACQVIITLDQNGEPAANLAAPLIVNLAKQRGLQVFQAGGEYSFRHPIAGNPLRSEC